MVTKIYYAYYADKGGIIVREYPVKETANTYNVICDGPFRVIRKSDVGKIEKGCIDGYGLTPADSVDTLKKSALAAAEDLQLRLAHYQRIVTKAEEYIVGKYREIAADAEEYGS